MHKSLLPRGYYSDTIATSAAESDSLCNIFNAHAIFLVKNPGRIIQHSLYICQAVWFNPHTVIQYADPQIRFMCITDN